MSVKHATPGTLDVDTAHGLARVHLHPADQPLAALVLGHGAAGGVTAPDLIAATDAAHALGVSSPTESPLDAPRHQHNGSTGPGRK